MISRIIFKIFATDFGQLHTAVVDSAGPSRSRRRASSSMSSIPVLNPSEPAKDRAQRLVNALAHAGLSEMMSACVQLTADDGKVTSSAACRRGKLRLVVSLMAWDGPTWAPTNTPTATPPPPVPILRDVERAILDAAPGPHDVPVTVKALARRAGYANTGHFREAVRGLIDRRLLERVRGGVRRRQ